MSKNYDTFLSYNTDDRLDVQRIYEYLTEMGLTVWFDIESIKPGDDWLEEMQNGLANSKTCLVFFRNESGVWQKEETKDAIRKKSQNSSFKIIPVILPGGADPDPLLPPFLKGTAWVDLRAGLFNLPALKRLVDAIRGRQVVPIHPVPEGLPAENELPTGYRADVNKIISLLIGEALYSRRDVSVRELIQNAIDACERRGNSRFGTAAMTEVIVNINTKEGFFEIKDNGDGMSPKTLSEYFAVVGRSIKDEENIIERTLEDEKTRVYLIAKFGIGFISTYMLARKILISTTYEGFEQINLEINGISDPFIYDNDSKVGRPRNQVGTTVRVYLKKEYLSNGNNNLDLLRAVEEFCRHVETIKVIKDGSRVQIKDNWNTDGAEVLVVNKVPFKFELHLGLSSNNLEFFGSNAGFLINHSVDVITPELMPRTIGGEINFFPGVIDLNIARDRIIENSKSQHIRGLISKSIRNLLIKVSGENNTKVLKLLRLILFAYLEEALKYEREVKSNEENKQSQHSLSGELAPPLSSIEAAELLMDTWLVDLNDKELPLRDALGILKKSDKYRVYFGSTRKDYNEYPLYKLFRDSLIKRGFLFVRFESGTVEFKSGKKLWVNSDDALKYLSKRYFFDLYSIQEPLTDDIEDLHASPDTLSPLMKRVLGDIHETTSKKIHPSRLGGAPVIFEIGGMYYLNIGSELFSKIEAIFEHYDETLLISYILGLFQFEIP